MNKVIIVKTMNDPDGLQVEINERLAHYQPQFEVVSAQTTVVPYGEMQSEVYASPVPRHVLYVAMVVLKSR